MYILVDHDNLPNRLKRTGLRGMADRFAELAMTRGAEPGDLRLDVKFYGGWFEYDKLTRMAQDLSSQIRRDFPYPKSLDVVPVPCRSPSLRGPGQRSGVTTCGDAVRQTRPQEFVRFRSKFAAEDAIQKLRFPPGKFRLGERV